VVALERTHIPRGLLHADGAFGSLTLVVEHGLVHEIDDNGVRLRFQWHLSEQLGGYGYAGYLSKPVSIDAPLVKVQIFFDYRRDALIMCMAGPLMNGVLIGVTLTNGYLYPIAVAGVTTAKFATMTLCRATHACWNVGVHYLMNPKKSTAIDEDWELVT
tara:strand:- start:1725 stop:2201 length:477 start_codon:yes stop_codon:yes gene_type:complete